MSQVSRHHVTASDQYVLGHHGVRLTVRDFDLYLQNCPVCDCNRIFRGYSY